MHVEFSNLGYLISNIVVKAICNIVKTVLGIIWRKFGLRLFCAMLLALVIEINSFLK